MSQVRIIHYESAAGKSCQMPLSEEVLNILPANIRALLESLPQDVQTSIEEIRLREGRPLMFCYDNGDFMVDLKGLPVKEGSSVYRVNSEDIRRMLHLLTKSSIYALEEELKNGFITIAGGHRVGLTGRVVLDQGKVKTMRHIAGLNIRILKDLYGVADPVISFLIDQKNKRVYHTLIVSPPQCGKTTLLRDLVRQLSNGVKVQKIPGYKIGLVDERSEIAGCYEGVPQLDIGIRTDVLDACPKANGMMMLLRSMSPEVIVADEIGREEDVAAIGEVINGGVSLIATAHGSNLEDLQKRPSLKVLLSQNIFERLIILGRSLGVGTLEQIIDLTNKMNLLSHPVLLRKKVG